MLTKNGKNNNNKGINKSIIKRDGVIVPFNKERITEAILKAMISLGIEDRTKADRYADKVVASLKKTLKPKENPTVEGVQDIVESILIEVGEVRLAREYITYRDRKAEIRTEKQQILEKEAIDEIDKSFDVNALRVLKSRYLAKNEEGHLIEGPRELFTRVALHAYLPSLLYDTRFFQKSGRAKIQKEEIFEPIKYENKINVGKYKLNRYHLESLKILYDKLNTRGQMRVAWSRFLKFLPRGDISIHEKRIGEFFDLMKNKFFIPNSPALMNFGRSLGMGSACFTLGIEDSMESIMHTLANAAFIFKAGGGVGYNFSKLRPGGDIVRSTAGVSSGPITFMELFDKMTEVVKQGGTRRGANMGILNSNHPDIEKFVKAKEGNKMLRNFNISVLLMNDFWEHYKKNGDYPLVNPRSGKVEKTIKARALFDIIVYQAWESAEPGIIFFDKINEHNPFFESLGPMISTNPCGELVLYPNESCNLGSINIHSFVKKNGSSKKAKVIFNWDGLKETIFKAVEFLDNVIDINKFPLKEIEEMTENTRKIGLGIMGLADAIFALRLSYDGKDGLKFMSDLMEFINYWSKIASIDLAKKRGSFRYFSKSFYTKGKMPFTGFYDKASWHFDWKELAAQIKKYGLRNSYTTAIAPTGSISMIAGTSSGIEPVFSLVFEKNVVVGSFYYIDPEFELAMKEFGIYDERLLKEIAEHRGSLQRISYLPPVVKKVFKVAYDFTPESHIRALAAFQKWVDSSISKTINFPANASAEDMKKSYLLAYELNCKDVTVYRDSSLENQVLSVPQVQKDISKKLPRERDDGHSNSKSLTNCPRCNTNLVRGEGCVKCPSCGWGMCA